MQVYTKILGILELKGEEEWIFVRENLWSFILYLCQLFGSSF